MTSELEPSIARRMWRSLEAYHGHIYFAPEAAVAYKKRGVKGAGGYFASRSAPMGAVPAEVVVATFFNFEPNAVRAAIAAVWTLTTPEQMVEARLEAVDGSLRRLLGDRLEDPEVARAAALARAASEACPTAGRPLFAAHASLAWPDPPHLSLWHASSLLREFRGDGHIACLVEAGLDGLDALVLHAASGEVSRQVLQATRRWDDDAWSGSVDRLARRGLVDTDGAFTEKGAALRQAIEQRTDELAMAPWRAIGADGCDELREIARPLNRTVLAGMGLPGGLSAQ